MLESRLCGLPFPRVQYQHSIFTNGLSRLINMGQTPDDGSSAHFIDYSGSAGGAGGKYSLGLADCAAFLRLLNASSDFATIHGRRKILATSQAKSFSCKDLAFELRANI
jgi:hypothetical protein